ncbi:MAG: hypothetical protein JWQ88_3719, partial [Rhodoferax sp.]|nr:hypothetical protein [Rhodoferax sp.]
DSGMVLADAPVDVLTSIHHRTGHLSALGMFARLLADCYSPGETAGVLQVWNRTCS